MSDNVRRCWGGPLDGYEVPFPDRSAFPWPRGWYYCTGKRYEWKDQPGTFIDQDIEWLAGQGFVFWQDQP